MRILNIQRMSTEDGPGLRTTVFLKGCPLSCEWCHNPESIPFAIGKEWIEQYCIFCGTCVALCPEEALSIVSGQIVTDNARCKMCLKCVEECPTGAMKALGKEISPEKLAHELAKDNAYFQNEGGVTFSGGECLVQADEVRKTAGILKAEGIKVAIDTSGAVPYKAIEKVLPFADLFLYDIKIMDPAKHKKYCKKDNKEILENLEKLSETGKTIWIRTPIIPGATDTLENIRSIAAFLRDRSIRFSRWELCAFNNLCKSKYLRLGIDWVYKDKQLIRKQDIDGLLEAAKKEYDDPGAKIIATGILKTEEKQ